MTTLPPERFYWALLDASRLPRRLLARGPARRQVAYLFEPLLPVPLESVRAVYQRLPGGRFAACAADEATLRAALDAGADSLRPASPPPFLDGLGVVPERWNFLTGPFEPRTQRRRRARRVGAAGAVVAVVAALLAAGMERRAWVARAEARDARAAGQSLLTGLFPEPSSQPAELRLLAELRRLRQAAPAAERPPPDAAETLAAVLARWPSPAGGRVESVVVAPGAVTLAVRADSHESAQTLAAALAGVPGWTARQPQVRAERQGVRLSVVLTREGGP